MRRGDMPKDQITKLATLAKLRASGGYYLLPGQTPEERLQTLRLLCQEKNRAKMQRSLGDAIEAWNN